MFRKATISKAIVSAIGLPTGALPSSVFIVFLAFYFTNCGKDEKNPAASNSNAGVPITVPQTYTFASRFVDEESSVSYTGQVVRQLLIQDLSIRIGGLSNEGAQAISETDLLNLYEHNDGSGLTTLTTTGSLPPIEKQYASISSGKSLLGKISPELVISTEKTGDQHVRDWFLTIAENCEDPDKLGTPMAYTDSTGVDLAQITNKLLIGAVSYSQAMGYLDRVLEEDNIKRKGDTSPYTAMEHVWDEAFGYFGAVRNYNDYNDDQLAGKTEEKGAFDANGDGHIDFRSEYNFGLARNAAKRDRGGSGVDFTKEIFDAFVNGRTIISNQGSLLDLITQRRIVTEGMEKVIASTVVHYVNDTMADMSNLQEDDIPNRTHHDLNKHWAEMKGFTIALQFSPFKMITESQLSELHAKMGDSPPYYPSGSTEQSNASEDLHHVKDILQTVYGFSAYNMANW